ncbi:GntR family transcriptional regulator [Roseobacter sp. YSTF-M11]|uniref:GntR family transcriptional regulator n=2 Tax=Roseobacter insulae TaxID=2859783 RepID=A0A9X1FWR4_9RHOB|nr:GntR family transcriptional regulator [Roseobacter insulae]
MTRDNSTYKETFNRALTLASDLGVGETLPTENVLSDTWGTSRTTVRAVLTQLDETGVISWLGRRKTVLRKPATRDFFSAEETRSTSNRVETKFMEFILGGDLRPGTMLSEAELVRTFGASTSVVRELLIRFSRFGLIEKKPNRAWVLRGFTRKFAAELFDVREMFERRAFKAFLQAGPDSAEHLALLELAAEHHRIVDQIETAYLDFPRLDERFHRVWIDQLDNRFVDDFFALISVIFHYHYRWNKKDERERNLVAAHQHLAVIDAVADNIPERALDKFEEHLSHARLTLMASVPWDALA